MSFKSEEIEFDYNQHIYRIIFSASYENLSMEKAIAYLKPLSIEGNSYSVEIKNIELFPIADYILMDLEKNLISAVKNYFSSK